MAESIRDARHLLLWGAVVFLLFCAGSMVVTQFALDRAAAGTINGSLVTDQMADYRLELPSKLAPVRLLTR